PDFSLRTRDLFAPLLALIPLRHTDRQALVAVRILLFHRLVAHATLDELILGLVLLRRRNRHRPHLPIGPRHPNHPSRQSASYQACESAHPRQVPAAS